MGLLKRRQDRKKLQKVMEDVQIGEQDLKNMDAKQAGGYVLDRCEQVLQNAREIDDGKKEYHIITAYLNDIETIENLPPDKKAEIERAAENVTRLNIARDQFLNTSRKISDTQFQMFQRQEDEIPDAVRRLRENENYQMTIRRDMQYLEGEKQEWEIQKSDRRRERKLLQRVSYILLTVVLTIAILLLVLSFGFDYNTRYIWIATTAVSFLAAAFILLRLETGRRDIRQAEVNINYAITLLNKVKIKYVNIKNAVDYTCEKYHVRDSRELSYQWDMYQEAVREQEKYRQTNEDLKYYYDSLVGLLQKCRLYDARVWIEQPQALVEPKEMVEIKHDLLVRRQKLRSKIAYNLEMVKNGRKEIDTMLQTHKEDSPQLREMLASIDRIAGAPKKEQE